MNFNWIQIKQITLLLLIERVTNTHHTHTPAAAAAHIQTNASNTLSNSCVFVISTHEIDLNVMERDRKKTSEKWKEKKENEKAEMQREVDARSTVT